MPESRRVEWSDIEPEKRRLAISTLRFSERTQPRQEIDPEWVDELEDRMEAGDNEIVVDRKGEAFDPLTVFYDGEDYLVADGHHRGRAARQHPDIDRIQVELYEGDKRDAVLYSVGANAEHGKQRTKQDKRQAVLTMLTDDGGWKEWSDREIARQCGVSKSMTNDLRHWLEETKEDYKAPDTRRYIGPDGEERTMDISSHGEQHGSGDEESEPVTWTVGDEESEPEGDGPGNVAHDTTQFQEMSAALESGDYVQYDVMSETTIASGPIRQSLEDVAPIDLMISRGPRDMAGWSEWVESAAHTMADSGTLVAVLDASNHVEAESILSRRLTHQVTQLLDDDGDWYLATYWNRSPDVESRVTLRGTSWSEWASQVAEATGAQNIAVPYAMEPDLIRGLIGPGEMVVTTLTMEDRVDALCSQL